MLAATRNHRPITAVITAGRATQTLVAFLFAAFATTALAHPIPVQLPEPLSTAEAFSVLQETSTNIDELLATHLLGDVQFQVANACTAAAYLRQHSAISEDLAAAQFISSGKALVDACRNSTDATTTAEVTAARHAYHDALASLERLYPDAVLRSSVFICPMHPLDRHTAATDRCSECGMSLVRRHLPASSIYTHPGQPSITMTVVSPATISATPHLTDVTLRLSWQDGSPVLPNELLVMHTQRIHLLINDSTLTDYQHVHPIPTTTPGHYTFAFSPRHPGPYRVWADVVPAVTGIQEYLITDLPAAAPSLPLTDRATSFAATVNGRTYRLVINDGQPVHAGQPVIGTIAISESDGTPCTRLEPVMEAFAHIVGFMDDGKTVLHIHPAGQSPNTPTDRGGPAFAFKLYVPTPGFLRLYAQVQIESAQQFAPFGLTILP